MASFGEVDRKLAAVQQGFSSPRVVRRAGLAAKKAGLDVAAEVAGSDRRLSHWGRRGLALGVGFDETGPTEVTLNLRPSGPWKLMEQGRPGGKTITPRKRGGKALSTPYGPRRSVVQGPMAGKRAISSTYERGADDARKAAIAEVNAILREVF